ncbi:CLN3 lysosomal/endosomal transmembrane protein, battenin isoform X2 [Oratosquilla oratoria]|uniref:CLN3 lysosomal/endosomal transmembrane protein, battenin isoform X2 n=1 Tax=Oratosquilla oratoria TaxID=337810 RepID=UPI003F769E07
MLKEYDPVSVKLSGSYIPMTDLEGSSESDDEFNVVSERRPIHSRKEEEESILGTSPVGTEKWRNLFAYWMLGLTNNFAYVIMLSAAHDILSKDFHGGGDDPGNGTASNGSNPRDCNTMSTGTILLADIIPSLIIKAIVPFITFGSHHQRITVVVIACSISFILVGAAVNEVMAIIGVACASLSSGLGEVTFLPYTSNFHRNTVSAWSSGTGGAGVFGALSYAGLTAIGLTPRATVFSMLVVPIIMSLNFWVVLEHPRGKRCCSRNHSYSQELQLEHLESSLTLKEKFRYVPRLLKFMIPLGIVYIGEYLINQGLMELVYFPSLSWLDHHEQYRWYQVIYQVGVMISRSSVHCFQIHHIWITSVLQWVNVILFLSTAITAWIGSIWVVFILIIWEGLLGGAAYVNTFYRIAMEVPQSHKHFAMSITTLADTTGIAIAGVIAIPVHNLICDLPL